MDQFAQSVNKEIERRALHAFWLSVERSKHQCPRWAVGTWKIRKLFLKIYKRAQIKNHFRNAYGKDHGFYHVDHIIPLHGEHVSGLHVPWNLHVLPAIVNMAKGTMIVPDYLSKGRYLKPDVKINRWK